jgi:hypothetical protein
MALPLLEYHNEDEAEVDVGALDLFQHYLPDFTSDLFAQHDDNAFNQFQLFGELPEELRLMIFKAAFPLRRTVQVELSLCHEILHSHTPPPITLRINRESRVETLKHYITLLKPTKKRPIYFHPGLDTIYFHRCETISLSFMASTDYITRSSLPAIAQIQSLKLTDMFYGSTMKCWVLFGQPRHLLYGQGTHPDRGGLRFFCGLRELILVTASKRGDERFDLTDDDGNPKRLNTTETIEECQRDFKGYFEWEKKFNSICNVPEIVVRQGREKRNDRWYMGRLEECFDEDRWYVGRLGEQLDEDFDLVDD